MAKKKSNNSKKNTKSTNKNSSTNKNNINKGVIVDNTDYDLRNKILVVLIVLLFFVGFYFLAYYITNKNNPKSNEEETTESFNYNNIVIGRSFEMNDEDYVVLYYDGSDEEVSSTYSGLMSSYKNKDGHYPIYYVNMGDGINKSKLSEVGNAGATNIDELTIAGPTLIHFSNGAIIEYLEGEEAITNYLS